VRRYAVTTAPEAIRRRFKLSGARPNLPADYNAAPGQELPVIRLHPESGERRARHATVGTYPVLAKDRKIAWKCVNARGETVTTAPSFRSAYRSRRCLVPADAFYEWKANGRAKQPYAIAMRHRQPFAFAGLWENWKDRESGDWVCTFTSLTTKPNELAGPYMTECRSSCRLRITTGGSATNRTRQT
jgi:putative SOS response-associated peptidase YedK